MATEAERYFDLSPTDRSMAILDRSSPVTFHVIWDLVGPLDLAALARCWQGLATIHPILACTADVAVDTRWHPAAQPLPFQLVDAIDDRMYELTAAEVGVRLDTGGPLVRLTALSRGATTRLVLGAHHAAFDGVASVVLLEDLRRVYVDYLGSGRLPPLPADLSPRTVAGAAQHGGLSAGDRWRIAARSMDRWSRLPTSTHADPAAGETDVATGYEIIELGPALAALDERRRHNRWPVDAVLVGVLEAAWTDVFGPGGSGAGVWLVASDLRHGLAVTRGIGNLSGTEPVAIRRPGVRPVEKVIEQAAAEMATWKSSHPGLGPELMARSWSWLPPAALNQGVEMMMRTGRRQRYTRTLSNLGRLPSSLSDWGQARMEEIVFLGPMSKGPYNSFIAFAFGSSSRLTARVTPTGPTSAHVADLRAAIYQLCDAAPAQSGP
ncbi:MAG TPA: hypothetical protein VLA54_12300 [Acidimicrobiia bacterium]|nr:hypothetical protein [Acidimicrobiia bacterium]